MNFKLLQLILEKFCNGNGQCGFNLNNNKDYFYENLMKKFSILKIMLILMILLLKKKKLKMKNF